MGFAGICEMGNVLKHPKTHLGGMGALRRWSSHSLYTRPSISGRSWGVLGGRLGAQL